MSVARIKTLFYLYAFFKAFILIYPLYAVMFADAGLDAAQISLLFMVWSGVAFVLEVPSGAIADKYPRKYVLIIATLFQGAAFASWLLQPDFTGFLVGFILWGINSALTSGTQEALIYDELKRAGVERQYARVTGKTEMLDLLGTIGGGFAAAALAGLGYAPILILSIIGVLVSSAVLVFLPKAPAVTTTDETKYWQYLSEGVRLVFRKRKILFLIVYMAIITGLGSVDEYYSLLFNEQGMSNGLIAFWVGVVFIFGAGGSVLAYRLEDKRLPLAVGIIVWGILLVTAPLLPIPFGPLAIGLYVSLFYIGKVLFNAQMQHELTDRNRATATSVGGVLAETGALVSFGVFAAVAEPHSYAAAFQVIAIVIMIAGIIYGILYRRYQYS